MNFSFMLHSVFIMNALTTLSNAIIECSDCPRLVAYRRSVAETKRRQFMRWDYWGRPVPGFGDEGARLDRKSVV